MNAALILSGGTGLRFGSDIPKQYRPLLGQQVIAYSIEAIRSCKRVDDIIIVCNDLWLDELTTRYGVTCVPGGETRNASLKNGLDYIQRHHNGCDRILINEAARPFITPELVGMYYSYLDEYDAVITAQHITDSLGCEGQAITDRRKYFLIQAPEAFRFDVLYKHFSALSPITATVQQLPPNTRIKKYFDFKHNMKITYREDFVIAELLMGNKKGVCCEL